MESITIFLAQLWGPAILAIGLGVLISKEHYVRIYREIQREPFALLAFGLAGIMLGIWHIQVHNTWGTITEMIISLFGWALLIKATIFIIKPNIADNWGDFVASAKLVPTVGILAIVLGGYLTWVGHLI